MAQQIILAAQLVPKFQSIGRCNNYVMLQSIICSPECKIVGQILLDHPLSYTITATADVPITYIVDMFRDTLHLPVETLDDPFIAPVNIKKKDVIRYPRVTKLIIADLMKKFPSNPQRLDEDYHSIKDDILLESVYSTGNVLIRGMPILNAFLTNEIRATANYTEYETVFVKNLKHVDDDDENEKEKKDEKKDDVGAHEMGSLENRNEKMKTPIPTTPRSPRINLSSDKTIV
ncbi:hypothetical protein Tco_0201284 [Tanacetum coccineum]